MRQQSGTLFECPIEPANPGVLAIPGDGNSGAQQAAALRRARLALYASHTLAACGIRAWEFAVGLLMLRLRPESLVLVSAFGLADSGGQVLTGAAVGSYLSRCQQVSQPAAFSHMWCAVLASLLDPFNFDCLRSWSSAVGLTSLMSRNSVRAVLVLQDRPAGRRDADVHAAERVRCRLGGGDLPAAGTWRIARGRLVLGPDGCHHRLRRGIKVGNRTLRWQYLNIGFGSRIFDRPHSFNPCSGSSDWQQCSTEKLSHTPHARV